MGLPLDYPFVVNAALALLSALAAGAQNSLAGGGTLYTFPVLMGILHDSVLANGTSTAALLPGSVAGAWGFRKEVRQTSRGMIILLMVPSLAGAAVGTWLVVSFPESWFKAMVPWLILTASVLFLIQPWIARWARPDPHAHPSVVIKAGIVAFQFLVAIYGGYFGAGIGILMLSSLALMGLGDIHQINALKTVLAAGINLVALILFAARLQVRWDLALPMALAAIVGGYLGARVARRLNRTLIRWLVIIIGFGLSAFYFARQAQLV